MISSRQPGTAASSSDLIFSRSIRSCLRNLHQRYLPYFWILSGFQIVRAESGDDELAGLPGVQVARPGGAGESLLVDLFLQHHEGVDQGLRTGRATGDVDVH